MRDVVRRLGDLFRYSAFTKFRYRPMRFPIRALFFVTAYFALILAAVVARSAVLIEIVSFISIVSILATLPLAIYDSNLKKRPFWCGFFVGGVGLWLLSMFFAFSECAQALAELIVRIPGVADNDVSTYVTQFGNKTDLNIGLAAARLSMCVFAILAGTICGFVASFHANRQ